MTATTGRYSRLSLTTLLETLLDAEEYEDEACVAAMEAELARRGIDIDDDLADPEHG